MHTTLPLPSQRVPFCTILRYPFLADWPEKFFKEPIYINFEGGEGQVWAKKMQFFGQILPKIAQKCLFWPVFFSKFAFRAENDAPS